MPTHATALADPPTSTIPRTMRAILKEKAAPGLVLKEVPVPEIGPNDVLLKIDATSICGTDLHIYTWNDWAQNRIKPPLVIGHECCGRVVKRGSHVEGLALGQRVAVETHVVCGVCHPCRTGNAHVCVATKIIGVDQPGCWAEYLSIPASNCWPLSEEIPPKIGTILEPYGNAVHTAFAGPIAARQVLVTGCGPIGLFSIAVARAAGASRVFATDVVDFKLEMAKTMGATEVFRVDQPGVEEAIRKATGGEGVDCVLEMSGAPAGVNFGLKLLRMGGWIGLLGLPKKPFEIDVTRDIIFKGVTVHGIIGRRMYETWYQGTALIADRGLDLSPVITHELPLDRFEEGFQAMTAGRAGKVILYP
jgi:threonine 3-dehydrogenase